MVSTRLTLSALISSRDYNAIVEAHDNTESMDEYLAAERRALDSRRKEMLVTAKIEMQSLSVNETASAHEIAAVLEKYAAYPSDVRDERDGLKARQAIVISIIKDDLRKVTSSDDVRAIDTALRDAADLIAAGDGAKGKQANQDEKQDNEDTQKDGEGGKEAPTNALAEALKDIIAELEERKKKLADDIKEKLKDADKLEDIDEITALIEQSEGFSDLLETERKNLIDKQYSY